MRITTVTNQKGGVGKTTTAHALATGLIKTGKRVLAIDLDPQSNLSFTYNANMDKPGIYEAFKGNKTARHIIQHTAQGDIITSNLDLAGADMEFTQPGREYLLKEILEPVKDNYDFIVIDTPPTLGILTINALTTSNDVIIPMGADIYSLQGLGQLYNTIENVKKYCNKNITIKGLLLTKYNARTVLSKDLKDTIESKVQEINSKLFKTVIREGIAIKEAQTLQDNIFNTAPTSKPAADYEAFIKEYLK